MTREEHELWVTTMQRDIDARRAREHAKIVALIEVNRLDQKTATALGNAADAAMFAGFVAHWTKRLGELAPVVPGARVTSPTTGTSYDVVMVVEGYAWLRYAAGGHVWQPVEEVLLWRREAPHMVRCPSCLPTAGRCRTCYGVGRVAADTLSFTHVRDGAGKTVVWVDWRDRAA